MILSIKDRVTDGSVLHEQYLNINVGDFFAGGEGEGVHSGGSKGGKWREWEGP